MTGLTWRDRQVPVSVRFDDPYYSVEDGLAEARHVFLAGNDLPARFRDGVQIAELGFGTGLNMLAALAAFRASRTAGTLHYTSFEAFPLAAADMGRALSAFGELAPLTREFLDAWQGPDRPVTLDGLRLTVIGGDARQTLGAWRSAADAWFLDGFAPARNPEMWEPRLIADVADHTRPGGTAATYSAAGQVREALTGAGFAVARVAGYGRKRHMVRAVLA